MQPDARVRGSFLSVFRGRAPVSLIVGAQRGIQGDTLHDVTLTAVHFDWREGRCWLALSAAEDPNRQLVFESVIELQIPRRHPWGPSVSINRVNEPKKGQFEIEVQSGDVIQISAAKWSFNYGPTDVAS